MDFTFAISCCCSRWTHYVPKLLIFKLCSKNMNYCSKGSFLSNLRNKKKKTVCVDGNELFDLTMYEERSTNIVVFLIMYVWPLWFLGGCAFPPLEFKYIFSCGNMVHFLFPWKRKIKKPTSLSYQMIYMYPRMKEKLGQKIIENEVPSHTKIENKIE